MTDPKVYYMLLMDHTQDTDGHRAWGDDALMNAELSVQLGGIAVTHCLGGHVASRIDSLWRWSQKATHSLTPDY